MSSIKSKLLFTIALLFFSSALQARDLPDHLIEITEASEVADFKQVDDALKAVTASVGECVKSGKGDYKKCSCAFPDKLAKLDEAIQSAVAKHPTWGNDKKSLYYYDTEKKQSSNIYISAIQTQLVKKCD